MTRSKPGVLFILGVLTLTLMLGGCRSAVTYTARDTTILTPKPPAYEVAVAYKAATRPHRVLGEVSVTREIKPSFGQAGAFDRAVEEMKTQARLVGGDAIVDVHVVDSPKEKKSEQITLAGTVIVYTAPSALSADSE